MKHLIREIVAHCLCLGAMLALFAFMFNFVVSTVWKSGGPRFNVGGTWLIAGVVAAFALAVVLVCCAFVLTKAGRHFCQWTSESQTWSDLATKRWYAIEELIEQYFLLLVAIAGTMLTPTGVKIALYASKGGPGSLDVGTGFGAAVMLGGLASFCLVALVLGVASESVFYKLKTAGNPAYGYRQN